MNYAQRLMALLRPLGVYTFRSGSFSMAQLEALGAQMDAARAVLEKNGRESIVMSAEDEGLDRVQALFRYRAPVEDVPSRRAAIAALMQVTDDAFTLEALQRCLPACGAQCALEEAGEANHVRVRFPGLMGIPPEFARMRGIIEDLLPAQLGIEYVFRWCTWAETEAYGLTWGDLGKMSWDEWRTYRE